jgi:antitoxin HicB
MKNLEYYMALKYRLEVEEIPDELGGGISLSIPLLGRESVVSDGETYDEAKNHLEIIKREFFEYCILQKIEIPEPEEEQEAYSGKFLIRVPKALHRTIAKRAKENGSSLNPFVVYLIQEGLSTDRTKYLLELSERIKSYSGMGGQIIETVVQPRAWLRADEFNLDDRALTWPINPIGISHVVVEEPISFRGLFNPGNKFKINKELKEHADEVA